MPHDDEFDLTRTHLSPGGSDSRSAGDAATRHGAARSWGPFRLIGELGHGAFGRVYHAWDATLARDIALKVVHLPDATRAATALHEGRMLARVRHRNVVTVYGAQQIGDEIGVWMELIRGRHLGQIVRDHGPMGPEEAAVVGLNVCQALAAVHAAGLLHRDIKVNNVMRESGGRIVLMDFGAGRESGPSTDGDFAGTPVYMAPEVLGGQAASPTSDLYGVGVLLFYVVTGEYPVPGKSVLELSLAHRRGQRRLLSDMRPDLPEGFVRVVERALASSPRDRPASAGAMLRDLAGALPGSTSWDVRVANVLADGPPGAIGQDGTTTGGVRPALPSAGASGLHVAGIAGIAIGGLAALAVFVGLLGFLTTTAFNQSLGRDAAFSTDRVPGDWLAFGAQSLFAPALLAALAVLAGRLAVTGWRLLLGAVPFLRPFVRGVHRGLASAAGRIGATGPVAASQWLLVAQILALALVAARFVPLMETVVFPGEVGPEALALLADESTEPMWYRATVTLVLLAMGLAWYALLSTAGARAAIHRTTVVAGAAVMAVALLMLVVPYRLLYHNEMPRTDLADGTRCYEVGVRELQVLLYCPDLLPPRVTIANRASTRSTGVRENIFSQAAPPR